MSGQCRRGASDRRRGDAGGGGGGVATITVPPASCPDLPRYHHQQQQQQQQPPGLVHHTRPSSSLLGTFDRVSLTERVWNLGRVTRSAAVHALRHSADGVRTRTPRTVVVHRLSHCPDHNSRMLIPKRPIVGPDPGSKCVIPCILNADSTLLLIPKCVFASPPSIHCRNNRLETLTQCVTESAQFAFQYFSVI